MILFIGFNSIIPIYFETEKKNQIKSISIEEIKKLFSPITIPFHTEYGKVDEFIDNSVKQCVKKAASNTNCSENERINTLNAVNRFQGCADTLLCDLFDVFSYFLVIFRFFFSSNFFHKRFAIAINMISGTWRDNNMLSYLKRIASSRWLIARSNFQPNRYS